MSVPNPRSLNFRDIAIALCVILYSYSENLLRDLNEAVWEVLKRNGVFRDLEAITFDWRNMTARERSDTVQRFTELVNSAGFGANFDPVFGFASQTMLAGVLQNAVAMTARLEKIEDLKSAAVLIVDPTFNFATFANNYLNILQRYFAPKFTDQIWQNFIEANSNIGQYEAMERLYAEFIRRNPQYNKKNFPPFNLPMLLQGYVKSTEMASKQAGGTCDMFEWPGR